MIGPDGTVLWSYQSPTPLEIPGANLIFDALDASRLRSGSRPRSAGPPALGPDDHVRGEGGRS